MISRSVIRAFKRQAVKTITASLSSSGIPRQGLLFYSRMPNTEEVLWADDLVIDDEYYVFGGWLLTAGNSDLFTAAGSNWYTDVDTPIPLRDSEILALEGINTANIFFSLKKGLAVYNASTDAAILAKAAKFYGLT